MPYTVAVALGSCGILGGAVVIKRLLQHIDRRSARRDLVAARPLTVASPEGEVARVTGVVRAATTTAATLSGRPCVVTRARFRNTREGFLGTGAPAFETFAIVPFYIDVPQLGAVRAEGLYASLDVPARGVGRSKAVSGISSACSTSTGAGRGHSSRRDSMKRSSRSG